MLITENTIVIPVSEEQNFKQDVAKYEYSHHRLSGINKVYEDADIIVYVFDANGDSPWEVESDIKTNYIALETYYGDGEDPWTRYSGKDDSAIPIKDWLKDKVPADKYDALMHCISYSIYLPLHSG